MQDFSHSTFRYDFVSIYEFATFVFYLVTRAERNYAKSIICPCSNIKTGFVVIFIFKLLSDGSTHEKTQNIFDAANEQRGQGPGGRPESSRFFCSSSTYSWFIFLMQYSDIVFTQ